ncbi:MAG: hypothetical protein ACR2PI_25540 [Hyphomicrobiaceae bacterium]
MKHAFAIIGLLALSQLVAAPGQAQVAPACGGLDARFERQDRIGDAYQCTLSGNTQARRQRAVALRRCRSADKRRLRDTAERRAVELERCLAGGIARAAGFKPGRGDAATQRDDGKSRAERIKELLAEGPRLKPVAGLGLPPLRDRTFRAGLVWSYGGPIAGMHCVQWDEPNDPHMWFDNYLCSERDVGFKWSHRGPILGRGLKCIQVREKSDPNDWHNNYFCWPRDLAVTFRFSASGRLPGMNCVAIVEPSDPHTWRDNYLCHAPKRAG